jgi:hypothetical protein
MPDAELNLASAKGLCEQIAEQGKEIFSWEWDPYFGAALSVIPSASQQEATRLLEAYCGKPLDAKALPNEPEDVLQIMDGFGGLRAGQKAFLSDRSQPMFVMVAWWPWGNGASISIRVKLLKAPGLPVEENAEATGTFRSWFGV